MLKRFLIRCVRVYQRRLSPYLGPSCRYSPTCSEYAIQALERYGAVRGGLKALWRLLRCHPFSKGGYDPVNPADAERYKREFLAELQEGKRED